MNPHDEQLGAFNVRFLSILGAVLLLLVVIAYFFYALQPVITEQGAEENMNIVNPEVTMISFKIAKNESFRDIAAHLSQVSAIKSIVIFKLYALLYGKVQYFQPGVYELSQTMSVPQIVELLTQGGGNEVVITIPEGSTLKDIDAVLAKHGVIQEGSLVRYTSSSLSARYPELEGKVSLEGFLFPDTYRFERDASLDAVVGKFFDTFYAKAWPLLKAQEDWYIRLTLASFLEREVPEFNDQRLVAGLLLKRNMLKMPLQVDATLSYVKCFAKWRECEKPAIARADVTLRSPYNTYTNLGWTPTPIGNPGQVTIRAAIDPEQSVFLYYLSARKTKETLFSKTLEEHNIKRSKYL